MVAPCSSRRHFLRSLGFGAAALAAPRWLRAAPAAPRPNIVLIMDDDMGFSDIGPYGGEIQTPHLDRLAANGIRFTQFYNTARCCPTRASLMSGLYAHQAGVGHMMSDYGVDGYRGELNRRCVTIAEVLQAAGYGTCMSGKWHVTKHTGPKGPKDNWPRQRGFERFFGTITGAGSFFTPASLTRDNTQIKAPKGFYYTHAISDHAAEFIRDHAKSRPNDPFFCYVAYTAPHWPLHALEEDIAKYRGRYKKGWDALRAERHERQIRMGLVSKEWPLTPRDRAAPAWEKMDEAKRDRMDLKMAIYAAQVDCVDQGVGRIIAALKETGRLENTLILFLADNGGCAEGGIWGFDRKRGGELGTDASFSSYGLSWANASDTPFRRYKHWVHEGGIASPLILHWPKGIPASQHGRLYHDPAHLIDLMATCVALAGVNYPTEFNGEKIQPMEGVTLRPAFDGKPLGRQGAIYWEHEGNRAVRLGKWKLVTLGRGPWELYDMEADRTELNNLAEKHPDKVKEMIALYDAWAKRANVVPWGSWRKGKGKRKGKSGTSKRTSFDLKQGDELLRHQAPMVKDRAITVTAIIAPTKPDGVLVAQGGTRCGWALYLKDGRLALATRRDHEQTIVTSNEKLPAGKVSITVTLARDGAVTFAANGKDMGASGKQPGAVYDMPDEPLNVGRDSRSPVGQRFRN